MDIVNLFTAIGGTLLGGGSVLFYNQNKKSKIIANESALVKEWEKLYNEEKRKREMNSDKLEQLSVEVAKLRAEVEMLKADKSNLQYFKCINVDCEQRNPKLNK